MAIDNTRLRRAIGKRLGISTLTGQEPTRNDLIRANATTPRNLQKISTQVQMNQLKKRNAI